MRVTKETISPIFLGASVEVATESLFNLAKCNCPSQVSLLSLQLSFLQLAESQPAKIQCHLCKARYGYLKS